MVGIMDKQKYNARQQRYRTKKARIEIMGTDELKQRFKALADMDGLTNADKLNRLCELWERRPLESPPQAEQANIAPFDLDSIEESLNGIEKDLNKDSRASAPLDMNGDEYFYTSNREHLKQHLNNVAKQMYKNSGHAKRYKVAGNNPEVKQACNKSEALTEIKTVYGGSVVAVIALGIVKMDVQMWGFQPEKYKRSMLWSAFKFSGAT